MPRRTGANLDRGLSRERWPSASPELDPESLGRCPVAHLTGNTGIERERERVDKPQIDFKKASEEIDILLSGEQINGSTMLELDKARGEVSRHLVSPLVHTLTVGFLDKLREMDLSGITFLAETDNFFGDSNVPRVFTLIRSYAGSISRILKDARLPTLQLTDRQRVVLARFYSFGQPEREVERSIIESALSITTMCEETLRRQPELGIESYQVAKFLRSKIATRLFRVIANGPPGFDMDVSMPSPFLLGLNSAGSAWSKDPNRPYIVNGGVGEGGLRPDPELHSLAKERRRENASADRGLVSSTGATINYSSGCPAARVSFKLDNPTLSGLDLRLNPALIWRMLDGPKPIAAINKDTQVGTIERDCITAMCSLLADLLDGRLGGTDPLPQKSEPRGFVDWDARKRTAQTLAQRGYLIDNPHFPNYAHKAGEKPVKIN